MRVLSTVSMVAIGGLSIGCGGDDRADPGRPMPDAGSPDPDAGPAGLPLLGNGTHSLSAVAFEVIADDPLNVPRDLAIHPEEPTQLWVVNYGDSSTTIFVDVGTEAQDWRRRNALGHDHFHASVSAMAFGAPGTFATAQDEDQITQPMTPADFMGPSLWPSDIDVYDGGHGSHLDMLHNSPRSTGIAWDHDNVYWVFDGYHESITRYDFQEDHGHGGADHSDGIIARYVEGEVSYVPGIASHMELDQSTGLLYVADTGNSRIAVLDTDSGTRGGTIGPNYDGAEMYAVEGATLETVVDGSTMDMPRPSGLALRGGTLFVGDAETSRLFAFDLEGTLIDWLDLSGEVSPGGLQGMSFDPEGRLYLVDAMASRVLRAAPRE